MDTNNAPKQLMRTYGVSPTRYTDKDGQTRFRFTFYDNGTDLVFRNFETEDAAIKFRGFLRRLKSHLGEAFRPVEYLIHTTPPSRPLTLEMVTKIVETARVGGIPPTIGLLTNPALANSVTEYQFKDGTKRYKFNMQVKGKPRTFCGFHTEDEAMEMRLRLTELRITQGDQFDPKEHQNHRGPEAPLRLPPRPRGLGRLTKTFGEFAQEWLELRRPHITRTRLIQTKSHLQGSVLDYWAYKELSHINEEAFQELIEMLLMDHHPTTVKGIGKSTAAVLVAARDKGLIPNPIQPYTLLYGLM